MDFYYRVLGRLLCLLSVLGLAGLEISGPPCHRLYVMFDESNSKHVTRELALMILGILCGIPFKTIDLFAEHGLRKRWYGWIIAPIAICLSLVFLVIHALEPSWVVAEIVFHGLIRGKVDCISHFIVAIILLSGLTLIPLCYPIQWTSIGIYIIAGLILERINKTIFAGYDAYWNQFRIDKMVVFSFLQHLLPFPCRNSLDMP
jgi:hypothetical protein